MDQQNQSSSLFQLNIDASNASTLRSAAIWARILGILGLIFGILIVVFGVLIKNFVNTSSGYNDYYEYRDRSSELGSNIAMVFFILFGALIIIGSVFALNFGSKVSSALRSNDSNTLRSGFAGVRNYFAFWSILMIIYFLLLIITIASGSLTRM